MSLDLASSLGVEVAINAAEEDAEEILKDLTDGRGPDLVIDAAGAT